MKFSNTQIVENHKDFSISGGTGDGQPGSTVTFNYPLVLDEGMSLRAGDGGFGDGGVGDSGGRSVRWDHSAGAVIGRPGQADAGAVAVA